KKVYCECLYICIEGEGEDEGLINEELREVGAEENVRVVGRNEVKYLKEEDGDGYDWLGGIGEGEKLDRGEEV
ncbi:hypothetical protein, partial [Priestia megaterium]|uniref:hypothetical protein n=1 Tax=Priestia megaterium TaxID=1404 RepID=UPI001649C0D5